jgi:Glycosyl transferase family 2
MKVAGICVFRNAADFIGLVILHHLLTLVDHVYCLDNGSTDGSFERVEWLGRRSGRIDLVSDPAIRPKREYLTALARRAHHDGFAVILAFDSDELWHGTRTNLQEAFSRGHNVVRCQVLNFIQRRSVETPSLFSWRHAIRRCATVAATADRVINGEISFMEWEFPSKVVFLGHHTAELHKGQHGVDRADPCETWSDAMVVFHLPMRAKSELLKRVYDYEPRRQPLRAGPGDAWQGLYWWRRAVEGHLDSEWHALSYDERGELVVNDHRVPTFIDRRLAAHLYLAALTTRYGCAGPRMLTVPKKASPGRRDA